MGSITDPKWVPDVGSMMTIRFTRKFTTSELLGCGFGQGKYFDKSFRFSTFVNFLFDSVPFHYFFNV